MHHDGRASTTATCQRGTLSDLRVAGIVMLVSAVALRLLPWHVGVACPLRSATGIPCPLCGMTTSVKATVGFDLREAFLASPAGPIAVLVAIVLVVWRRPPAIRIPTPLVLTGLTGLWIFQLFRFQIL